MVLSPGMISCFHARGSKSPLMWSIREALYNSLGPTKDTFCYDFFFCIVGFPYPSDLHSMGESANSWYFSQLLKERLAICVLASVCVCFYVQLQICLSSFLFVELLTIDTLHEQKFFGAHMILEQICTKCNRPLSKE